MKTCASTIRLEFIQDYTLKSLRLKQDKWNKLVISDEQRGFLHSFVDQGFPQELVISQNIGGQLQVHTDWPSPLKNKGVFFVKREKEPLPENVDELLDHMVCGDIPPNALDQFCALVEEVVVPLFKNETNICKFPKCLADDIKRQVPEQKIIEKERFKKEINKTQRMQDKFKILDESPRCTSWQQQSTK